MQCAKKDRIIETRVYWTVIDTCMSMALGVALAILAWLALGANPLIILLTLPLGGVIMGLLKRERAAGMIHAQACIIIGAGISLVLGAILGIVLALIYEDEFSMLQYALIGIFACVYAFMLTFMAHGLVRWSKWR
ncbi:hypothetical protein KJ969_01475 [Patescibacteria group bacterium]|nr:hypothetical protein [Patescibacteria group bacterium]MBU1921784.1 hypothetical protein [Patescibacteria group bacterium]